MTEAQKVTAHIIADTYPVDNQMVQCMEEMAGLTQALIKYRRADASSLSLIGKIADVEILLEQIKYSFDADFAVCRMVDYKLARQMERIEK